MSRYRVEGYYDNGEGRPIAYTVDVDSTATGKNGVITHAMPERALHIVQAHADLGEGYPLADNGNDVPVSLTTPEGVYAGLRGWTEIARTSGDIPGYDDDEPGVIH